MKYFFAALLYLLVSPLGFASDLPETAGIDGSRVAVAGLSSGAFMSVQLAVSHSSLFSGVGVFAGGIYDCAQGNQAKAGLCMTSAQMLDVNQYVQHSQWLEKSGTIDSLSNLKNQRIYLFAGKNDKTTPMASMEKLYEYYNQLADPQNIAFVNNLDAGHGQPTVAYGNPCSETDSPWIINCGYDGAGQAMQHIYGALKPPAKQVAEHFHDFDQSLYADDAAQMSQTGSVYIPEHCQKGGTGACALLVALHGCRQSPDQLGATFREHAGYNEWAEANDVVVLYPASKMSLLNPRGCWDWWGYSGLNYADKRGAQIRAITAMVNKLLSSSVKASISQ